jgi:hypothetical protein
MTFTTSAKTLPLATTGPAESVTQLTATLTGTVDTRGLPTVSEFEFGTAPYTGTLLPATVTPGSGTLVNLSTSFNDALAPATTYYYRVLATNVDGTTAGAEQSFTTGSFPAAFTFPASLPFVPYTSISELEAREAKEHTVIAPPPPKPLTNAQKLAKALAACHKDKKKAKRQSCERAAHKKYGPFKKKKG